MNVKLTGRKAPTRWRYEYKQNGDLYVWHPMTWGLRESDVAAAKEAGIRKRVRDYRNLRGYREESTKPSDWFAQPVRGLTGLAPRHEGWVYVVVREQGALEHDAGPLWKHDCDHCEYLGRHSSNAAATTVVSDLYACRQFSHTTLIVRSSSCGPDYTSMWVEDARLRNTSAIREALRRFDALSI